MFGSQWIKRAGMISLVACFSTIAAFADPTSGWTEDPLSYKVQSPYNLPVSARFTITDGVYHLWVFKTDKPFSKGNTTRPRTEMRFPEYTSGSHQYAANLMVPTGSSGFCVYQIHTGDAQSPKYGATQVMLFFEAADGGSVHIYHGQEIAKGLYNKYWHLNATHDVSTHVIDIYINDKLVYSKKDNGAGNFYMKSGAYAQSDESSEMQTYETDPSLWSK